MTTQCPCGRPLYHRGPCATIRKARGRPRFEPEPVPPVSTRDPELRDLDLAIANGWGDTPQAKLPPDWRTRKNRAQTQRAGA